MGNYKTYKQYNQAKIDSNIAIHQKKIDGLIKDRNQINTELTKQREQIKYWLNINPKQSKLF